MCITWNNRSPNDAENSTWNALTQILRITMRSNVRSWRKKTTLPALVGPHCSPLYRLRINIYVYNFSHWKNKCTNARHRLGQRLTFRRLRERTDVSCDRATRNVITRRAARARETPDYSLLFSATSRPVRPLYNTATTL